MPNLFGLPLFVWIGILLFLLILFQFGTGKRWIKLPFVWHSRTAYVILILGITHGFLAMVWLFGR